MNKKGIAAIVATVLTILITVAAISIVWVMITPVIKDDLSEMNVNVELSIVTVEGYTVWDVENRLAIVQVKRGNDKSDIIGLELYFMMNGTSVKYYNDSVPEVNSKRVYYINLSNYSGDLSSISVAPIFRDKSVGPVSSKVDIKNIGKSDIEELIDSGDIDGDFVAPSGNPMGCTVTTVNNSLACYDGNVYWYNNCGGLGVINENCGDGCGDGVCSAPELPSCSSQSGNICGIGESCSGNLIDATDSDDCCDDVCYSCLDGIPNQDETNEGCGGPNCAGCGDYTFDCLMNRDCASYNCNIGAGECSGEVLGPKILTGCEAVRDSGRTYNLIADIVQIPGENCIEIFVNDTMIDCQGYSISTTSSENIYGIWSNSYNTTIKNCEIIGFDGAGIYFDGVTGSVIADNIFEDNGVGISLYDSDDNILSNNFVNNSESYDLFVLRSSDNVISRSEFCSGDSGDVSCASDQVFTDNYCDAGSVCGGDCVSCSIFGVAQEVSECGELFAPDGNYYMSSDIENNDLIGNCLEVTAPNVTLNCFGNAILGEAALAGVFSNQDNTTVNGCNISVNSSDGHGIWLEGANGSYIFNNTLDNQYRGIWLDNSQDVTVLENNATGNSYAFVANYISNNNNILNNVFCGNTLNDTFCGISSQTQTFTDNYCDSGSVCGGVCIPC